MEQAHSERNQAQSDLQQAEATLVLFNEIDPSIAAAKTGEEKVAAIRAFMSRKPGVQPTGIQSNSDSGSPVDGVDWDTLNALPHIQQEIDQSKPLYLDGRIRNYYRIWGLL